MAADRISFEQATGKSTDVVTGEPIIKDARCCHIQVNARCAFFITRESLQTLIAVLDDETLVDRNWLADGRLLTDAEFAAAAKARCYSKS
jgi:hypothetical protein